jgi:lysozyme family protein
MAWTYEATKAGYANLWDRIAIKGGADASNANRFAKLIIKSEATYRAVEKKTGVPWYFIGALHMRESSCNFAGVLHNGEHILGTGRKTKLVPRGRGPFPAGIEGWIEAAVDALQLKGLHRVKDWNISRIGFHAELYNGTGYIGKGVNSAYLWAGSNLEQRGKYVRDHVWDGRFDDPQIGVMTVLKRICELRPDVAAQVGGHSDKPRVEYDPRPAAKSRTIVSEIWYLLTAAMAGLAEVFGYITDWRVIVAIGAAVALFVIYERLKKGDIVWWFAKPAPVKKKKKKRK